MLFDQHIIDEIQNGVSLRALMESFGVKFAPGSSSAKEQSAFCPFHDNKNTPAMSVNDRKGVYHCFSCNANGNAIKFLTEHQRMTFRDAVKHLAAIAKIDVSAYDIPEGAQEETEKVFREREQLYQINQAAQEYFRACLTDGSAGKNYLKRRGLTDEVIGRFSIGYCPDSGLLENLRSRGFIDESILASGLVASSTSNNLYDFFYGRVTFPIYDRRGRLCGFSGRIPLEELKKKSAKYINTAENAVFQKRFLAYHFHDAADEIRAKAVSYVVEGYMDVIGMVSAGITNVVAPMGTSLTEYQLKDLVRAGAEEVVFLFDGDAAGRKAADRAVRMAVPAEARCSIVVLPEEKDPFDLAQDPAFQTMLSNKKTAIEFELEFLAGTTPPDKNREAFISAVFRFIALEKNEIRRSDYLEKLWKFIGKSVEFEAIAREFRRKFDAPDVPEDFFEDKLQIVEIPKVLGMNEYQGPYEFDNQDGSRILITKDYRMYQKKRSKIWDNEKHEYKWDDEKVPIQSSHALFPRYKINGDDDFIIVFECKRAGVPSRYISISGRKFGETTKLQNEMVNNEIAINVGKMRAPLFSYALTYTKEVKNVVVGVNYIYDDNDNITGSFLVGYNFIYKNGKSYRAKDNIVEIDGEILYITGHDLKKINETSKKFYKPDPQPEGKTKEFIKKADELFKSKEKSRIAIAFLGVSLLREQLLERFSDVPLLNFYGKKPSTGKTTFLKAISMITNQVMHRSKITEYQLYSLQAERANGLILIDDMRPIEYYTGFLKDASANSYRPRINMEGKRSNPQIRNSVFMTTNHPITTVGDNDTAAVESRILNIPFYPEDQNRNVDAYGELISFVENNRFDIYIELYEKMAAMDMNKLTDRIRWIERAIQKENLNSVRIAELWAILLAVGENMGIGVKYTEYMDYIKNNEKQNLTKDDLMIATLVECAKDQEEKSKPPENTKEFMDAERIRNMYSTKDFEAIVIPKVYWLKFSDLSEFIRHSQMLKDYSQENIIREFYGMPFVEHHRLKKVTRYRDGKKESRTGTYLKINFGHEDFSKFFNIEGSYVWSKHDQDIAPMPLNEGEEHVPEDPGF